MNQQQCGVCGAFLSTPKAGERWRVCGHCGTELEITQPLQPQAWPRVDDACTCDPDADGTTDPFCASHDNAR